MTRSTIVCTGPISDSAIDILAEYTEVIVAQKFSHEILLPLVENAIALVVRGVEAPINAHLMDSAPRLKVIGRPGAGYDNIDIAAATARGIPVVYAPGMNARAVAEGTLAFMLALCKRIPYFDSQLKQGNWRSRFETSPGQLEGSTLGIIGFGSIGRMVARLVAPLNMTLLAYDPYADQAEARGLNVELTDLERLLQQSDVISIHAAQTKETKGLISSARLQLIRPGSLLINMARGGLIESLDCLYEALEDGRLAGVGLDVFEPEPPDVSHPIFRHPNCLTSPHAMALTPRAMVQTCESMADDIIAVLTGKKPTFVVNAEVLGNNDARVSKK